MFTRRLLLSAILLVSCVFNHALAATATSNLQVNMQVNSSCTVTTLYHLDFGVYNTTQANNAKDATGIVAVTCVSNSSNVRVSIDEGQHAAPGSSCEAPARRMHLAGGHYLSYNIYSDTSRTQVRGCAAGVNDELIASTRFTTSTTSVSVSQYGRIFADQDPVISASSYTDVIGVTVSF